jgi:hypothetical protein
MIAVTPWPASGLDVMTAPFAGQPGHGSTAFVRNQPARIADGRFQAGSTVVLLRTRQWPSLLR